MEEKTVKRSITMFFLVGYEIQRVSGRAPILSEQTSAKDSAQPCDDGLQTVLACPKPVFRYRKKKNIPLFSCTEHRRAFLPHSSPLKDTDTSSQTTNTHLGKCNRPLRHQFSKKVYLL